jgi:Sulfotransferase family
VDTNLVFLCGFPSSGTDLLKNVINAHPDVWINGEFPFLHQLASIYGTTVTVSQVDEVIAALRHTDVYHNFANPNPNLTAEGTDYSFAEIYAAMLTDKPCRWKGNKTPQNTEHIDALRVLFPGAKFIVIIRDVREVALSWSNKWGKHKVLCAAKWNTRMLRGARLLQELKSNDFLLIKYEALLSDLENTARRICDFLQIEYCDSMIEFHKRVHTILDGKVNYGRALIKDNSDKWITKLSAKQIRRIEEVAFQALRTFDYPITMAKEPRPITKWEKYGGLAWDVFAVVFVGNRAVKGSKLLDRWKTVVFEIRKLCSRSLPRTSTQRFISGSET